MSHEHSRDTYSRDCHISPVERESGLPPHLMRTDELTSWHPEFTRHTATRGRGESHSHLGSVLSAEERRERTITRRTQIRQVLKIMSRSALIDLVFLVDCTGSMQPWIEGVKQSIRAIIKSLHDDNNQLLFRLAFVRYTDFDVGSNRTSVLPFTEDVAVFERFVGAIHASGGGDGPEDVMGGLRAVCDLDFRHGSTRVLVHIATLAMEASLQAVVDLDLQYHFGYIKPELTKSMIAAFDEELEALQHPPIVCFDAMKPATLTVNIATALTKTITRVMASRTTYTGGRPPASVVEALSIALDPSVPLWHDETQRGTVDGWVERVMEIKRYLLPDTLEECLQEEHCPHLTTLVETLRISAAPFERGGVRMAYRAFNPYLNIPYVVKVFQDTAVHTAEKPYLVDMHTQCVAAKFAAVFQSIAAERGIAVLPFKYCPAKVVRFQEYPVPVYGALEPELDTTHGKWIKWNSNAGLVHKDSAFESLQAFSHWTWVVSGRTHLVCDLQGLVARGSELHTSVLATLVLFIMHRRLCR
ncbi:hypothetical protein KIPB_000084 [Kipferlia bialata]|uniref:Alpha-type protein kinase domain-containing protein n=1 Tax=Kipferlia bialata TaxID=797122 RepID=A0A9K3GD67_9EUKA|nr:hypothetical protein KIPB_000084 [Kipferlia bialata]|eukprot:g84.t1